MQRLRRHADDPYPQARVHERLIQKLPLEGRHAPVFSCLPVEEHVCSEHRTADDRAAVEQALGEGSGVGRVDWAGLLHVGAAEGG